MPNLNGVPVKLLVLGVLLCCNLAKSQNPDQQQQRQRRYRQDLGQVRRGVQGGQGVQGGAQKRSDGKSSSSWPSSESLWSDIPKSDNFDLRNWRSWHQNGDGDDDDHGEIPTSLQGNKQFKRNIPPPQTDSFNNFNSNKDKPNFYPSAPISNPSFPKSTGYNPQQPQPYQDDEQPDFNYNVNYNEGDDKPFQTNFPEQSFKKSPQVGTQHGSYPSSSFTPSFGGSGFPTSIDYNSEPQSNDPSGFYDEGNEGRPSGGARGQEDFDFTGHFGDPTDKDGRIKSPGVSQSYSTFTGPDGKSNGFFVKDHNNGALPAEQIKHQIESSINNLQGNLKPGSSVRGFNTNQQQPQRPTSFEDSDDDDEDESSPNSFGGSRSPPSFGSPPSINFGDTERYKRGSQTQERFHKNDKNSGGKNTQKTYRQPLPKIQYNRPDPDTDSKTYDDTYGTIKTFKGGYSSEDKDAHLRPPPTYNYELIDDEDGEGKFEQPQGQENETFKEKNEPEEDYYIPKGQEEKVRPKYEEMAYEDRWRNRQDRKMKEKEGNGNDSAAEDEEAEGGEGREAGEGEGQGEEEEEEEEEPPAAREPSKADKNKQRQQQTRGRKNVGRKMTQRKRQLEVDSEDESKAAPTWIWDPAHFKFEP